MAKINLANKNEKEIEVRMSTQSNNETQFNNLVDNFTDEKNGKKENHQKNLLKLKRFQKKQRENRKNLFKSHQIV